MTEMLSYDTAFGFPKSLVLRAIARAAARRRDSRNIFLAHFPFGGRMTIGFAFTLVQLPIERFTTKELIQ